MKLTRIKGPATICHCAGCHHEAPGGTEPFLSASTGETRMPEDFYVDESLEGIYCAACAAKLVCSDPTRSLTRFFLDTGGTQIDPEVFA